MIILDEKMPPPPPYTRSTTPLVTPPPFPPPFPYNSREPPSLGTLPAHLILRIVYATFTTASSIECQRKTLYWLTMGLRLVNRSFYIACMHVLRSTYLPAYSALVKPPYTSDPFPLTSPGASAAPAQSPVQSLQRETRVLDLFIALKVREDVWADDSELHLERDESFRDLFDLMQPRSRMEDLVRGYGVREGVVAVGGAESGALKVASRAAGSLSSRGKQKQAALPFSALSVTFSSRRLALVLTTKERKKTIVEVPRTKDERLEVGAKNLVRHLRTWLATSS